MSLASVPKRLLLILPTLIGAAFVGYLVAATSPVSEGPVGRADCGQGSRPETGLQGQVPLADRENGRSTKGYRCNLELVGQRRGNGASWVSPSYRDCAYIARRFGAGGVEVIDVSDPRHPRLSATLDTPGMLGPWESLRLHPGRGLLAAVTVPVPPGQGGGFVDVYDIEGDCREPRRVGSISALALLEDALRDPLGAVSETIDAVRVLGHEAAWSPDGRTYWTSSANPGHLVAIDVSDPADPRVAWAGFTGLLNHGFGFSPDGNQLYMAEVANFEQTITGLGLGELIAGPSNGLKIFDVSEIQAGRPNPRIHEIGHVFWSDGGLGQHTIAITYADHPYVVFVDEALQGAARIIDVADPTRPRIVSKLKLEIQMPEAERERAADLEGEGFFGYEAHYCTVDRQTNPSAMACGYFQSGVRVFDIRNPLRPREIAYFNPPAQSGEYAELAGSEHAGGPGNLDVAQGPNVGGLHGPAGLTADWCSSPPRFVGRRQLWVTCQDNGFMVLRFTNDAYPVAKLGLSIRPARATPGCRRFRFRTTTRSSGKVVAVPGARVRFDGRTSVTDRHGRTSIRACLRGRAGKLARADARGYERATARVRPRHAHQAKH